MSRGESEDIASELFGANVGCMFCPLLASFRRMRKESSSFCVWFLYAEWHLACSLSSRMHLRRCLISSTNPLNCMVLSGLLFSASCGTVGTVVRTVLVEWGLLMSLVLLDRDDEILQGALLSPEATRSRALLTAEKGPAEPGSLLHQGLCIPRDVSRGVPFHERETLRGLGCSRGDDAFELLVGK